MAESEGMRYYGIAKQEWVSKAVPSSIPGQFEIDAYADNGMLICKRGPGLCQLDAMEVAVLIAEAPRMATLLRKVFNECHTGLHHDVANEIRELLKRIDRPK